MRNQFDSISRLMLKKKKKKINYKEPNWFSLTNKALLSHILSISSIKLHLQITPNLHCPLFIHKYTPRIIFHWEYICHIFITSISYIEKWEGRRERKKRKQQKDWIPKQQQKYKDKLAQRFSVSNDHWIYTHNLTFRIQKKKIFK